MKNVGFSTLNSNPGKMGKRYPLISRQFIVMWITRRRRFLYKEEKFLPFAKGRRAGGRIALGPIDGKRI